MWGRRASISRLCFGIARLALTEAGEAPGVRRRSRVLGPSEDPLTLWPFPGRQEDLETLSQDKAEKEEPLRGWRRNRGRNTQRGMAAQKPRVEGAAQKGGCGQHPTGSSVGSLAQNPVGAKSSCSGVGTCTNHSPISRAEMEKSDNTKC